jgi:hypothetical protein
MIVTPAGQGCITPVADPRSVFLERNAGCIFVYYLFRPIIDCRKHFVENHGHFAASGVALVAVIREKNRLF